MSTIYSTVLMILSFNQKELQDFLDTIFDNIWWLQASERGFSIFLFKNCIFISICHDHCGSGQEQKAEYIKDRNQENDEIVLMYPSFCLEFWIWRVTIKRETKEGSFAGTTSPYTVDFMEQVGKEESAIDLSTQGKCVDISDRMYHLCEGKKLEKILKKIQGELDAGENVPLDEYSFERFIEYRLKHCLTEDYKNRSEAREKERIEWCKKRETDDINSRIDKEQYKKWEKINPYPYPLSPMTNDVDMEKAYALLEEHRQGAWRKGINIEAFVDEFGIEISIKGPAERNKLSDQEEAKRDLLAKEKEFLRTNCVIID